MSASSNRTPAKDLALVAVFAALIVAFSLTPAIPVGVGVPITLQTLAVALTGLVLGPWRGFLAASLYVVVGLAGLPVFAGGAGGLAVLAKPSVGYLLAFPLGALVTGAVARALANTRGAVAYLGLTGAGLLGSAVIHLCGIFGMMAVLRLDFLGALGADLPFIPGDVVKMAAAAGIAVAVQKAFPALLAGSRPVTA